MPMKVLVKCMFYIEVEVPNRNVLLTTIDKKAREKVRNMTVPEILSSNFETGQVN